MAMMLDTLAFVALGALEILIMLFAGCFGVVVLVGIVAVVVALILRKKKNTPAGSAQDSEGT